MHSNPDPMYLDRRTLLKKVGLGLPALGLASLMEQDAPGQARHRPHFQARAKHVVHLFMNGGPSQVDTFDPKPELANWHGKEIGSLSLRTERRTGAPTASRFRIQHVAANHR